MSDVVAAPTQSSPQPAAAGERLGVGVIWSFTLSRVAFSIMGVMFAVYLMKYATDVLLIAPATMGILLAAADCHWHRHDLVTAEQPRGHLSGRLDGHGAARL